MKFPSFSFTNQIDVLSKQVVAGSFLTISLSSYEYDF